MSKKEEKLQKVLESGEKDGQINAVVVALLVGLITLGIYQLLLIERQLFINDSTFLFSAVLFFLWKRGVRVARRGICMVGLCESGKTLIFSQLVYKKAVDSFTSMKENVSTLNMGSKVLISISTFQNHFPFI